MSARRESTSELARLLRPMLIVGVYGSFALIMAGVLLCFFHHPGYLFSTSDLDILTAPGAAKVNVADVFREASHLRGQGMVLVGLILLMATPFLGVTLSLGYFLRARQRSFVVVTATVLTLLLLSLVLGRAAG